MCGKYERFTSTLSYPVHTINDNLYDNGCARLFHKLIVSYTTYIPVFRSNPSETHFWDISRKQERLRQDRNPTAICRMLANKHTHVVRIYPLPFHRILLIQYVQILRNLPKWTVSLISNKIFSYRRSSHNNIITVYVRFRIRSGYV